MKTITTTLAALLITLSISVFASDEPVKDAKKVKSTIKAQEAIKAPAFVWGDPTHALTTTITEATPVLKFPAFVWGNPDDINRQPATDMNRISFPALGFGNPDDVHRVEEPAAKISFPEFVWGNEDEIE